MGFKDRVAERIFGDVIARRVQEYVSRAEEDMYFRRMGAHPYAKDLPPSSYDELHSEAYEAYTGNPLAFRCIEIIVSYVWGQGAGIKARDERIKHIVDEFWERNKMERKGRDICREYYLYGEQFIRWLDGGTIWQLDPSTIDEIETASGNVQIVRRVHQVDVVSGGAGPGTWFDVPEEVQHFAVNKVSNAVRGRSTLWVMLPWLRRYKDWLTDRVRLNKARAAWMWLVKVQGASQKELDARAAMFGQPPEPGSVMFHNEREEWVATGPNVEARDVWHDGHALKLMIAVGAGVPIHWLSEVASGTRAVAAEMGGPTLRTFESYRADFKFLLREIIDKELTRVLGPQAEGIGHYQIIFPELEPKDALEVARSLSALMDALREAVDRGWISNETAQQWLFEFSGHRVDFEVEIERIEREKTERAREQVRHTLPQ